MLHKLCVLILGAAAALAQSPTINPSPSREFGHLQLQLITGATSAAPNLVEGRELNGPLGIAFDAPASILYVADTGNNRVLAWRNPSAAANAAYADLVIGQRDKFSTFPQGPGLQGTLSTGLSAPIALAVDTTGNLYVLDAGNNRILRYPAPFSQQTGGDPLTVDLVIGQRRASASSDNPNSLRNEGNTVPSNKSLAFRLYDNGPILAAGMTLDAQGGLWVTDPSNNRVLHFPASQLAANTLEPQADIVLGQKGVFTTGSFLPGDSQAYEGHPDLHQNPTVLNQPSSVAVDRNGRLYVSDDYTRVLYYKTPGSFSQADRILGIPHKLPQGQQPVYPNADTVGVDSRGFASSARVFTDGTYLYVCDIPAHRITRYDVPDVWPARTDDKPSPALPNLNGVYGQDGFNGGKKNRGSVEAVANGFNSPIAGAFLGSDMWVVDAGNNRVLQFAGSALNYPSAVRVVGQIDFGYSSPNLVEGRELFLFGSNPAGAVRLGDNSAVTTGGDIVVDKSSNPPHLYVADTNNNRILGFVDARNVGTDSRSQLTLARAADLVIGQSDKLHTTVNYPSGLVDQPSDTGLYSPTGLAVDAAGNLWVADMGNGRVVRFPAPFKQPPGPQHATLVLGKGTLTATTPTDPGLNSLNAPYGLAILSDGSLAISDISHNRVAIQKRPAGGDFSSGQRGLTVLGQQDFSQQAPGSGTASLRAPTHIAADTSDRLYVCDTGNNRVLVFNDVLHAPSGASAVVMPAPALSGPTGIIVSPVAGDIWLANTGGNQIYRLPNFDTLQVTPNPQATVISSPGPLALTLDSFDNVIVAEAINRVTFYYAALTFQHAANYNSQPLAPGQLALLYRLGKDFDLPTGDGTGSQPWPKVLADYRVSVNGIPAPIFRISKTRIDFQVPMSAPESGQAEFQVTRDSTGEVVATANIPMQKSNPGFFTSNAQGTGQAAAINDDFTVNGPANPVGRGKVISFYMTGQGAVDSPPPDGVGPSGALNTRSVPSVFINGCQTFCDPKLVLYSGLAPGLPGLWQINLQIPDTTPPGPSPIIISINGQTTSVGPSGSRVIPTFVVK